MEAVLRLPRLSLSAWILIGLGLGIATGLFFGESATALQTVADVYIRLMQMTVLPYLVLAATGPLMQEWFRRTTPGVSPYRLYALSNVGSLLALVSYPFYFEPNFTRHAQAQFWSWGLGFYALCCGYCAYRIWRAPAPAGSRTGNDW